MTKYYRELWNTGPVRTEARRLAKLELEANCRKRGEDPRKLSHREMENAITVLLFNSEDIFLKRAKFNLEKQT